MDPLTDAQIVECDQSGGELAVQKVVRLVDCADTRICVVVGVHAETKGLVVPQRSRSPVRVVVTDQRYI